MLSRSYLIDIFRNNYESIIRKRTGGDEYHLGGAQKILEEKGFLAHKREGKKFIFYPLVEKPEYNRWILKHMKDSLFGGSAKSLLNTFIRDSDLTESDITDLMLLLKELKEETV